TCSRGRARTNRGHQDGGCPRAGRVDQSVRRNHSVVQRRVRTKDRSLDDAGRGGIDVQVYGLYERLAPAAVVPAGCGAGRLLSWRADRRVPLRELVTLLLCVNPFTPSPPFAATAS